MAGHVVIYPRDWRFRPTPAQLTALIDLLRREGVLDEPDGEMRWKDGPGFFKLGIHAHGAIHITIALHDKAVVFGGEGFDLACPRCGHVAEDWSDLMDQMYEADTEPDCHCARCGAETPLSQMAFPGGGAIATFGIDM